MKRQLAILCAAALIFLFAAVGAQAADVVEITLSPGTSTVDVGARLELDAELTPADADAAIRWTSSRPQYATVKAKDGDPYTCVIKGKAMGKTIITARAGGKSVSRMITVTKPWASSIKLNRSSVTLNPKGASYSTYTLRATTTPSYHSDTIHWEADPESGVVSIEPSEDGKTCTVTAVADGSEEKSCMIKATTAKSQRFAACQITVKKIPEKYVRVTTSAVVPLNQTSPQTRPLTYAVYPVDAFDKSVTWSVSRNPDVASVDQNGVVTGLKAGNAIIRVTTANGSWAQCTVSVKPVRYSSFSVSPSSKVLERGATFQINTKRSPTYVSYPDLEFESDDESVARVDKHGVVTGVGRGYAKITVTGDNGRVSRSVTVRIIDSNSSIEVTVSAIGDVMLGGDPRKDSFKRFDKLWKAHEANYFFAEIKNELIGVVFANLEIPLYNTSRIVNGNRSYIFCGRKEYALALSAGGIDAVDLDNNHIMDYGSAGFTSTKSAVRSQGVGYFGRGSVYYTIRNGIKIGFVGFRPESISISKMKASVKAVKSRCDIVIASFHWGRDYIKSISASQRAYGRAAVQAGADLVVGHHSHVVSGIEKYTYKGRSAYIVYGLGTIVSAVTRPEDIDTFIYQHTFSVTGTTVSNADAKIVPVKMTKAGKTEQNDAQPYIAEGDAKREIIDKIKQYSPDKSLSLFK